MVAMLLEKLGWTVAAKDQTRSDKDGSYPGGFTKDQIAYARELAEQERRSWDSTNK